MQPGGDPHIILLFLDPSVMPDRVFANSRFYLWILSFGFLLYDLNL